MNQRLAYAAAAAFLLAAAPALAQAPGEAPPKATPATPATPADPGVSPATPATPASPSARSDQSATDTTTPSAGASGANASVTTGMDVKDNTGATIGKITDVKAGAGGKQTATIKMGTDTFAVDTTSLAVASGAATVNASQDEIRTMLKKK